MIDSHVGPDEAIGAPQRPPEPPWARNFRDTSQWWRRVFSEVLGTFLLVLGGLGAHVAVSVTGQPISRAAAVTVPGLTVMAAILFMGNVGGAHLNPVVSIAFALRGDFPWRRVPGYIASQVAGGLLAGLFLWALFGHPGSFGATVPGPRVSDLQAMLIEVVLTMGLVSVILGTASTAQNVGPMSAIAVGGYIALAGLWADPLSGASMNPVRSFAPDLVRGDLTHTWLYVVGPLAGALLAVAFASILRGPGGDFTAVRAAQGRGSVSATDGHEGQN
ncbi:MAG TPA: MIP/aquaporin family protein [Candidatus Deferrimicrobium sp.]|nr:MIP/aquaporin family protein [Candidatus Deferrimicrobium sp.]